MDEKSAPATQSAPFPASPADGGRRRQVGFAISAAGIFLIPVLFGFVLARPAYVESDGGYALTASAAGAFGGEEAYLPPAEPLPADITPPPAPVATDAPKTQSVEKSTTAISNTPSPAELHATHDAYCNFYAQAVTGNVTPEQAARRQQTNGAIMGAVGGALLGTMFGALGEHPGRSTMLGASTGLVAGAAMASGNAQRAANEISKRYGDAYSTCMNRGDVTGAAQQGG